MGSEDEFVEELEVEGAEETEVSEVEEEELEEIPVEGFNEYDIEIMLKKAEIWDKLAKAEISPKEAEKLIKDLTVPTATPVETPSTKRRRRRSSKSSK